MKKSSLLLAYLLCIMQTTSFLEANIIDKITAGATKAADYVKNFCNVMGDLSPVDRAVNGALKGMTNVITSISLNVKSMEKSSIDMNNAATHFNKVDSVGMSDLKTIIPKSQEAVKDIEKISTDVAYIIVDIGSMANSIKQNTPAVAAATQQIGETMHKVAKLLNNDHPQNESIYKDGDSAIKIGQEISKKVDDFYDKFASMQKKVNQGIKSIQEKTNEIMSKAQKPLQQLQGYLDKIPANKVAQLENLLKSHPYQAAEIAKGAS